MFAQDKRTTKLFDSGLGRSDNKLKLKEKCNGVKYRYNQAF